MSGSGADRMKTTATEKSPRSVGRYSNTVADHYVPYMRPQENGYKTDVRWLSLSNDDLGLLVKADELLSFGVSHNRLVDFVPPVKIAITSEDGPGARDNDERINVHVNDVKPRDLVSLDIDLGQMGVGGDDSWGKRTLQKYTLNEESYRYSFTLTPYRRDEGVHDELVTLDGRRRLSYWHSPRRSLLPAADRLRHRRRRREATLASGSTHCLRTSTTAFGPVRRFLSSKMAMCS